MNPGDSLFERLGGEQAVHTLVGALYFNLLNDPRLSVFFRGASMQRILEHQRAFFQAALGGESTYNGRDLFSAHQQLIAEHGLSDVHFDLLLQHLRITLLDLEIDPGVQQEVLDRVEALRPQLFGRQSAGADQSR